eukprot:TRINITY_DN6798_c0_g1_i1.p1 TRINITY_DN6798_c0_g1~~TRINITY_DN6798_c0_g1_i1.p1  ORF type:complete len:544 (+),score=126.25 TRINITY_DN6798_c0_g1_i1:41-1672(+)
MTVPSTGAVAQPLGEGRESWLFDKSHLIDTCPTIQDGKTMKDLARYKFHAYDFAQRMIDALLAKSQNKNRLHILATTMQLVHRFYVYQSIVHFHWLPIAQAALFAALKMEESVIRTENFLKWAFYLKQKVMNSSDKSKKIEKLSTETEKYYLLKDQLHRYERIMLQTVGFDFNIELPIKHLMHIMKQLKRRKLIPADTPIRQTTRAAWYWCTACYGHHDLCLLYSPVAIAIALFYGVMMQTQIKVKTDNGVWWRHIFDDMKDLKVTPREIPSEGTCARILLSFYRFANKHKLPRQPAKAKTDPEERVLVPADPHTYLSPEQIKAAEHGATINQHAPDTPMVAFSPAPSSPVKQAAEPAKKLSARDRIRQLRETSSSSSTSSKLSSSSVTIVNATAKPAGLTTKSSSAKEKTVSPLMRKVEPRLSPVPVKDTDSSQPAAKMAKIAPWQPNQPATATGHLEKTSSPAPCTTISSQPRPSTEAATIVSTSVTTSITTEQSTKDHVEGPPELDAIVDIVASLDEDTSATDQTVTRVEPEPKRPKTSN